MGKQKKSRTQNAFKNIMWTVTCETEKIFTAMQIICDIHSNGDRSSNALLWFFFCLLSLFLSQSNTEVSSLQSRLVLLRSSVRKNNYCMMTHAQGHNRCGWKHKQIQSIFKLNLDRTSSKANTSYFRSLRLSPMFTVPAHSRLLSLKSPSLRFFLFWCEVTHTADISGE